MIALDDILTCLIEADMSAKEIVERGHEPETVSKVWKLLGGRRIQAPPGAPGGQDHPPQPVPRPPLPDRQQVPGVGALLRS